MGNLPERSMPPFALTGLQLLLILGLCQSLLMIAIIPPWQGPDETRHFEYVRLLYDKGRLLTAKDTSLTLQQEILDSMQRYDYWRFGYTQFPYSPQNPPTSFKDVYWPVDPYWLFQPPLYYVMAAAALVPVAHTPVDTQLYALRLISLLPGLLTIWVAFLVARELFPDDPQLIVGIPAFVALLPMQAFINSTVSNDQLAELFASLFFLGIVLFYKHGWSVDRGALIVGALVLALLTKRTALVTVAVLMLVGLDFGVRSLRQHRRGGMWLLAAGGAVIAGTAALFYSFPGLADRVLRYYLFLPTLSQLSALRTIQTTNLWGLFGFFSRGLFESFWGRFGWLNVRLAPIWYLMMGGMTAIAFLGIGEWFMRPARSRPERQDWQRRVIAIFAISVLLAVTLAIGREFRTWSHFVITRNDSTMFSIPQGRYIFPVMIPIATLFVLGIREIFPRRWRSVGWSVAIVSMFVLNVVSIVGTILPFYLRR